MAGGERTESITSCEEGTVVWALGYKYPSRQLALQAHKSFSEIKEKDPESTQVFGYLVDETPHVIVIGIGKQSLKLKNEYDEACSYGEKYEIPAQIGTRLVVRHLLSLARKTS